MPALSIIIPTLNATARLADTIRSCQQAGEAAEIIVADGGSTDGSGMLAWSHGVRVLTAPRGRGAQLMAGAGLARSDWLLFLHADTVLPQGWWDRMQAFMQDPDNRRHAGYCRFRLDDASPQARRLERLVAWRCRALALPYGDQGLLLRRRLYHDVGGFRPLPLMEDVDLVRRLGRRRLVELPINAVTSAERWRRDGWWRRSARNLCCLALYYLGVPPRLIARLYA